MRRVIVLGSTGSIGTQALDVIRANPRRFELVGIAAGTDRASLDAQAEEFQVEHTALGADEADVPARRRLHKRDVSVSPERVLGPAPKLRSMFDLLGKRTSPKRKRPMRSEYVEGEAEESDDEVAFGFGARKPDDDEEEDGEDQDKHLEDLVDDKEMDAETLAEDAVLEKVR